MTFNPSHSIKYLRFDISILTRDQANQIDSKQWEKLSKESIFDNPFFHKEWLLLSLKHLQREDEVYIVTVKDNGHLVSLFPIQISNLLGLRYFNIWQHNHCFANTPLVNINLNFKAIICRLCILLNCQWGRIHLHHPDLIPSISPKEGKQHKYQRAYIKDTSEIRNISRAGKFRRENRRLIRKASKNLNVEFFEYTDINLGLEEYSKIEHNGWKGKKNGSILSLESTKAFYFDLFKSNWAKESISVFGLNSRNGLIACALRVTINNSIFEIKTTYDENYYQYAPGRVLEVFLLDNLAGFSHYQADSCTSQNNTLINQLWKESTPLFTTIIYSKSFLGGLIKNLNFIKNLFYR